MSISKSELEAKEVELKLIFDPEDAAALFSHPLFTNSDTPLGEEQSSHGADLGVSARKDKTRELVTVYYDTDQDVLRRAGVFLRVRKSGDGFVQTIKTARGLGEFLERDEWECALPSNAPDLAKADGTALAPLLSEEVRVGLRPRFETRFQRRTYRVTHENAEIELAIDQGEVTTGDKETPLCELELELKAGDRAPLFSLAKMLTASLPLTLGMKTKAERGFDLLDGGSHLTEKARAVAVKPEATCAEAFRIIARNCLRQMLINLPATRRGHSEALHQMRVGLRRMRVALSLFGPVLKSRACRLICAELKWVSGELGPARDFDVLIADVLEPHHAAHPNDPAWTVVYDQIIGRRAEAYEQAIEALSSARFRLALLDLGAFIEFGEWGSRTASVALEPVAPFAAARLSRLRRKLEKNGQGLRKLSDHDRHRLRIVCKHMRYGSEFFASTFAGNKRTKRHLASHNALEKLSSALGVLNDMARRQALWGQGGSAAGDLNMPLPKIDPAARKKHLKAAIDAYGRFTAVGAFWNG